MLGRWIAITPFMMIFLLVGAGSASAATNIDNCSVLSTAGETYVLTQDIINSPNTTCISFTADNATLDCAGRRVDGVYSSSSYGIRSDNRNNVTIKNCNASDWWFGVYIYNTGNSLVYNTTSVSNNRGVYIMMGSGNNVSNCTLKNNHRNGVEIVSSSYSNVVELSDISYNDYNGIYVDLGAYNNFTQLNMYYNNVTGINFSSTNNNTIFNCTVYSNVKYGMSFYSSNENIIQNTTFRLNNLSGVYLYQSSARNRFYGVNSSLNDYHGFYVYSSSSNSFYDTSANKNDRNGMYLESSSNNSVYNCNLNGNLIYGAIFQLSDNNNFTGCKAVENDQGIRVYDANNNYFTDFNATNSTTNDVYATSTSQTNNYLSNVSFADASVYVGSSAIIWIRWHLDVGVLNETGGTAIENANVTILNSFGSILFNGLTNSSGQLARRTLTEYNQTSSGKNYYSNYTINTTRPGFVSNSTSVNLTVNVYLALYLEEIGAPRVEMKTYDLGLSEKESFKPGRIVRIRAFVNTSLGRSYLSNATVIITNNLGSTMVDNALMINVSEIENGYVYEYNYTIPSNADGLWPINITAADAYDIKGYAWKKIAIYALTIQVKLVLNSTSDAIYVPYPALGEITFSQLTTGKYYTPEHYYIASYSGDALKAVVSSSSNPLSIITEKGSNIFSIGTEQRFANSMVFVVFSKGSWTTVNNRLGLIEKGEFLTYPEPSFGFGLGTKSRLKTVLQYQNINLNRTLGVGRGYNTLSIENLGRSGGTSNIRVQRV